MRAQIHPTLKQDYIQCIGTEGVIIEICEKVQATTHDGGVPITLDCGRQVTLSSVFDAEQTEDGMAEATFIHRRK